MTILSRKQTRILMEEQSEWCVSTFMRTHRAGRETQQDPIRLKNLLAEAEQRLLAKGLRAPEVNGILTPARELLDQSEFWRHQSDGLALFMSTNLFRRYRLPYQFDTLLVIGGYFHVKPLLALLSGDGQFYVLAVSQNDVRLFQGTRHSVSQVDLEHVPTSLAEALRYDDFERQLQFHTGTRTPGGRGRRPGMFHGHGVGTNDSKENILRYFHKLDAGLNDLLEGDDTPLVLAAVDYLHPLYEQANSWPGLVARGIIGNPDELSAEHLHEKAWAIVEPMFRAAQQDAATLYQQLIGTGRASSDIRKVVPQATYGRVATLFVSVRDQIWGHFDQNTGTVEVRGQALTGDRDLLDVSAIQTLLNGGTVYAVEPEKVPGQTAVAAIFRH